VYFGILGPLEVSNESGTVTLRGPRQRILLSALLSAANTVVSVDLLTHWLWPGTPPASAPQTIQEHVSRLRRALEPDRTPWSDSQLLVRRAHGYLLRTQPEEVDALRFEDLVAQGQAALERNRPTEAAQLLRWALELWRGPALADVAGVPAAQPAIARLEGLRLSATVLRIDADLALGRHVALVPELEDLVRGYPYDERLCGQLMIALYRSGRQAQSLAAYQRISEILAEELAIEPEPASQRLRAAILAHDPALDDPPGIRAGWYRSLI
jgi:SARP family transcriptional regulator, regulator of embCAB operon